MGNYYGGMEFVDSRSLKHYGIKGQKHGIRRFQNEDGTLTDAGKRRYDTGFYRDPSTGGVGYRVTNSNGTSAYGKVYKDSSTGSTRYKVGAQGKNNSWNVGVTGTVRKNTASTPYSHSGSASQRLNYTGNRRSSAPVHTKGTKESEEAQERRRHYENSKKIGKFFPEVSKVYDVGYELGNRVKKYNEENRAYREEMEPIRKQEEERDKRKAQVEKEVLDRINEEYEKKLEEEKKQMAEEKKKKKAEKEKKKNDPIEKDRISAENDYVETYVKKHPVINNMLSGLPVQARYMIIKEIDKHGSAQAESEYAELYKKRGAKSKPSSGIKTKHNHTGIGGNW